MSEEKRVSFEQMKENKAKIRQEQFKKKMTSAIKTKGEAGGKEHIWNYQEGKFE